MMRDQRRIGGAVLLLVLAFTSRGLAQPRTALVVPWSAGDADPAALAALAGRLQSAVPSGDVEALPLEAARQRFEQVGSAEPPSVTDSDIERWLSLSRQAVRHLAHTDYASAREALLEAQRLSNGAAEELNRELTRARQVLDTCLYDVRRLIETDDPRAEVRARECRRMVPRVTPSPYNHTPEVVELLARIDSAIAESPPGSLRLEAESADCVVRLNGIELGRTPFVGEDLQTGDYSAQVECDERRGRVHRIHLTEGATTVRIDTRFDAVVRTDTVIRLAYSGPRAAARRLEDAVAIGRVVGASEVWLASSVGANAARLDAVEVATGRVRASVVAEVSAPAAALGALIAGRSVLVRDGVEHPLGGAPEESPDRAPGEDRTAVEVAGAIVGVAAIGAIAGAIGAAAYRPAGPGTRLDIALPSDPDYLRRYQAWLDAQYPIHVLAAAGGALGVASVALLSREEGDVVPWWSLAIGGTGLALVVIGVVELATTSTCPSTIEIDRACVDRASSGDRSSIWIAAGAPALALPIAHAIRAATGGTIGGGASISGERILLHVEGSL